jgi:hypothetical protein
MGRALAAHRADAREARSDHDVRLQQQQLLLRAKLDGTYDDRLSGRISDELWSTKSRRTRRMNCNACAAR